MAHPSRMERSGAGSGAQARQHVVVVVDDDAFTRKALFNALSQYPCRVLEASSGLEGLRLINQTTPDLLLLDVRMPVMSGLELLKELRSSARFRDLPVIALSGSADRKVVLEFVELGITGFLVKPLFREALFRRIDPVFESLGRGEAPIVTRPSQTEDKRPHVLVADVDGNFRGFVRSLLEGRMQVLEAQTGVEAYELLTRQRPSFAVIGGGLPLLGEAVLARVVKAEGIDTKMLLFTNDSQQVDSTGSLFHATFKRTFVPDVFLEDLGKSGVLRSEANSSLSEILVRDVSSPLISAVQQCLGVLANREVQQISGAEGGAADRQVTASVSLMESGGTGQFTVSFSCSTAVAELLGEQILGGPTTLQDGALEALAEVVNTVGGRVREAMGNFGHSFDLRFPVTRIATDEERRTPDLSFTFLTNAQERFVIEVSAGE